MIDLLGHVHHRLLGQSLELLLIRLLLKALDLAVLLLAKANQLGLKACHVLGDVLLFHKY